MHTPTKKKDIITVIVIILLCCLGDNLFAQRKENKARLDTAEGRVLFTPDTTNSSVNYYVYRYWKKPFKSFYVINKSDTMFNLVRRDEKIDPALFVNPYPYLSIVKN